LVQRKKNRGKKKSCRVRKKGAFSLTATKHYRKATIKKGPHWREVQPGRRVKKKREESVGAVL